MNLPDWPLGVLTEPPNVALISLFLVISLGMFFLGAYVKGSPNQKRTALLILAILAGVYYYARWQLGAYELSQVSVILRSMVLFIAVFAVFEAEKFWGLYDSGRRRLRSWVAKHVLLTITTLVLLVFGLLLLSKQASAQPSPFLAYVEKRVPVDEGDGKAQASLGEALNKLETTSNGLISIDPTDRSSATLRLVLSVTLNDCDGKASHQNSLYWGEDPELNEMLTLVVGESETKLAEDTGHLCNWDRTTSDIDALIQLAYGLDLYYHPERYPEIEAGAAEDIFRRLANERSKITRANYAVEGEDDLIEAFVLVPRQIWTCAEVMGAVADGPNLSDTENKRLRETIIQTDPYTDGDGPPPPSYCLAQAYYALGRDSLEDHLGVLAEEVFDPESSFRLLEDAIGYFDLAIAAAHTVGGSDDIPTRACSSIQSVEPDSVEQSHQSTYYYYCGLAHYRRGSLADAYNALSLAFEAYGDTPVNELSRDAISYMRRRVGLESLVYRPYSPVGCASRFAATDEELFADAQLSLENTERLEYLIGELSKLQSVPDQGQMSLAVGTTALFHEALFRYWQDRTSSTQTPKGSCGREKRMQGQVVPPVCRGIDLASQGMQIALTGPREEMDDAVLLDVMLAKLAVQAGQLDILDGFNAKRLELYNASLGKPAYVIPVTPRFSGDVTCASGGLAGIFARPTSFTWLIRNRYDEPVLVPPELGQETSSTMLMLRLYDGRKLIDDWRVQEAGYGLYESEPVEAITTTFTVDLQDLRPDVWLTSDPVATLVRRIENTEDKVHVGMLHLEVPALLTGAATTQPADPFCESTLYDNPTTIQVHEDLDNRVDIDVDAILSLAPRGVGQIRVEASEIRIPRDRAAGDQPSMVFLADVFERSEDENSTWQLVEDESTISLTQVASDGRSEELRLRGRLCGIELASSYAVHLYVIKRVEAGFAGTGWRMSEPDDYDAWIYSIQPPG